MFSSICEIVSQQVVISEHLMLMCDWVDQGVYFYGVFANLSEEHQIVVGMLLGGLATGYLRRLYIYHLRKRLLKLI